MHQLRQREKLYQFFLASVFKREALEYTEECVSGIAVDYTQPAVGLLEMAAHPCGIFRLLDSECRTPKGTDLTLCAAILKTHPDHPRLAPPPKRRRGEAMRAADTFTVRHFAAAVTYTVHGFLEKNNDALDPVFMGEFASSSSAVVRGMAAIAEARHE